MEIRYSCTVGTHKQSFGAEDLLITSGVSMAGSKQRLSMADRNVTVNVTFSYS